MQTFNPGSSTLQSIKWEDALHEAIQLYAQHLPTDAKGTATIDIEDGALTVSCNVEIPLEMEIQPSGTVTFTAIDETPEHWTGDPQSDASAQSLSAQIFAIATKINKATEVLSQVDRCQLSISTDSRIATVRTEFLLQPATDRPAALKFTIGEYVQSFD